MALGSNVRRLREQHKWRLEDLAQRSGVDVGTISALENRDSTRSSHASALAKAFGVSLEALVETSPPHAGEPTPRHYRLAQDLSHLNPTVIPQLDWGTLMDAELPPRFELVMPDDSMRDRVKAGQAITFSTTEQARPGDGVLVQDRNGNVYIRIYRQRRIDAWEAHPLHDAYQALDSERDGLRVLAVVVGVPARWG